MHKVVSLMRDEIKLSDSEAKGKVMDIPDASGKNLRLGMIDLPSFYASEGGPGVQRRRAPRRMSRN